MLRSSVLRGAAILPDRLTILDGLENRDVFDMERINSEWVFGEDDEIGILACFQRSFELLVELLIGCPDRETLEGCLGVHSFCGPKDLIAAGLAVDCGPPQEESVWWSDRRVGVNAEGNLSAQSRL